METYGYFVLIFFTVFAVLQPAQTLMCHMCAGTYCGDPFNAARAFQIDCPGLCEKRKITGLTSEEATSAIFVKVGDVARRCYNTTDTSLEPGCEEQESDGVKGEICFCKKQLCNGGNVAKVSMATGTTILLISVRYIL